MDDNTDTSDVLRHDVTSAAIEHICDYFDEHGLNIIERWHVCESVELAALGIMGAKLRDLCEDIKKADLASISASGD